MWGYCMDPFQDHKKSDEKYKYHIVDNEWTWYIDVRVKGYIRWQYKNDKGCNHNAYGSE